MTTVTPEIFDPVDRSIYGAPLIEAEILRDAQFSTLETNSQGAHKFILVEGVEGIGKTALLSQFVQSVKKDCIALFIDPINKNSYREESLLVDLYVQINEYLGKSATTADYTEAELQSSLHGLKYLLNSKKSVLYFVIDGLDELPEEFSSVVKKIFEILPTASLNIKYVFSICNGPVKNLVPEAYTFRMTMMLLSIGEAQALIPQLDQGQIEQLLTLFPRKPSIMVHIRRLLQSGITYEVLVNGDNELTRDLYEFEWNSKIEYIERISEALSILAFSENNLTLKALSGISSDSETSIISFISDTNILTIKNGVVNYISAGMKKYAAKYFDNNQHDCSKKIVSYLQGKPNDIESLSSIAGYLSKSGQNSEVIHQLDNKHLESILELSLSFSEVVKQVDYGISASISNKSEGNVLRFAQLKSFITDSSIGKVLTSELYTYLEIDDIKSAMDFASSARSIEEKIQLYSKIAKHQSEQGRPLSDVINNEITYLYKKINPVFIGVDRSVEIAIDLFPVYPDYSLSIINRLDSSGAGENKSDYAFFRFSLALMSSNDANLEILEEKSVSLSEKKKTFFSALSLFKRGTPAKKILDQIEKIKEGVPGEQLFILRNWIKAFPDMEDNYVLVAKAISLAISTTAFSANAGFYLDMTGSLDGMSKEESSDIYQRILIQLPTLRVKGPTIDYVSLELHLHLHEAKYLLGANRIDELYHFIAFEIPDLAIALAALSMFDKYVRKHSIKKYLNDLKIKKSELFKKIIDSTANQFDILKPAFMVESEVDYKNAFKWASQLNIQERRDEARKVIIGIVCGSDEKIDVIELCQEIKRIEGYSYRRSSFLYLINHSLKRTDLGKEQFKKIRKTMNSISEDESPCLVLAKLIEIGVKNNVCTDHELTNLKTKLTEYWSHIDTTWNQVDVGFKIHNRLNSIDKSFAEELKNKCIQIRIDNGLETVKVASGLADVLDLALRALRPLFQSGLDEVSDLERLKRGISSLPGTIYQVKEFSRLASMFQIEGELDLTGSIIENHIIPLIDSAEANKGLHKKCLMWSMPVLYRYSPAIFERYRLLYLDDHEYSDRLGASAILYIYNKVLLGDPFDPIENYNYKLSFKDVQEILTLIGYMEVAPLAYVCIDKLSLQCLLLIKAQKLSVSQINVIDGQIEKIIQTKIKHSNFINHNGYYICSVACQYRMKQVKSKREWDALIELTSSIPNASDVAFVLYHIASCMPSKMRQEAKMLLEKSEEYIDTLPSVLDQLDRYGGLSEIAATLDKKLTERFIKKAVFLSSSDETEEFEEKRSQLIDIAYAIDKELPSAILALSDQDPARTKAIKDTVEGKKEDLKVTEDFQNNDSFSSLPKQKEKLPSLAWKLFKKINGHSYRPKSHDEYINYLDNISLFSSREAYPIISYFLASQSLRYCTSSDRETHIRPLFNSLISNFNLLLQLYNIDSGREVSAKNNSDNFLIESDSEEAVVDYVKKWIAKEEVNEITIIDPYLTIDDFKFIGACIQKDPNFTVKILTGTNRIKCLVGDSNDDVNDVIYSYWVRNVAEELPSINLVFAGLGSLKGRTPFHDRWWIADNSGLRFGGSINGIGGERITEISSINPDDRVNINEMTAGFVGTTQKVYKGERIKYSSVTL